MISIVFQSLNDKFYGTFRQCWPFGFERREEVKPVSKQFHIVINANGGTVLKLGRETVHDMIRRGLPDSIRTIEFVAGAELQDYMSDLARSEPLPFLVGGGDGTALTAAQTLRPLNVPFAILPLGTMNLLARDLGASPDLAAALPMYLNGVEDRMDIGMVNGHMFLCSAIIGIVPESAIEREKARETGSLSSWSSLFATLARGLGGEETTHLILEQRHNRMSIDTSSLIISNNPFVKHEHDLVNSLRRESLKSGRLAVYSASTHSVLDGLRLLFKLWQGSWQEDDNVMAFQTEDFTVIPPKDKTLISLDGEAIELEGPLHFSIEKSALPIIRAGAVQ